MIATLLEYPFSSLVYLFPRMSPEELARLVASIREHGLLEPIVVWRREIIDGLHRALACLKAGVEPAYRVLPMTPTPWSSSWPKTGTAGT